MKRQFFMGMLAFGLLGACTNHNEHASGEELRAEKEHNHADEIILTPDKAKAAGLKVEKVAAGSFRQVIQTTGQILSAQGNEATVVANVAGTVSFIRPLTEGLQVSNGAGLISISTARLQDGDPVERARVAYEAAKEDFDRASKLVDKQIVSRKEFTAIRERYENARIAYEAFRSGASSGGVCVSAPINGYIKNCLVKEGDYVAVGQPMLTISQTRRLQLKAEVSERHYQALQSLSSANFRTPYDGMVHRLDELGGKLLSYGKSSSDNSFYIPVNFEFDNSGTIIPGSFVEVYLLGNERQGVISVPVSALTEEQGLKFVYVQVDAEGYKKREVKTGATDGRKVEILSGLKEGERVVTEGAVHVKLASASNIIPAHTHNH
ncbi:efflux RND transporter periplasmic adaptor subunit [uncultured Bacteroides sp.]|uniref:efflux RND transporter periplasmic adaptor subunit n=1 Tax=uncultured Bacteroides sp. TaxID=162156 RepID=UPI0026216A72|nr:efflux RND transporter periplasmic adaptor subunit [uncultured Bacteroides sp.]